MKQLRFSILGIFNIWEYDNTMGGNTITRYKLLGITIAKKWSYTFHYRKRSFWK